VLVLGLLVVGQWVYRPSTYMTAATVAGIQTNAPATAAAPKIRQFQIFDGQFRFDLDQVPVVGPTDAPHFLVSLFDYSCHYCRDMHGPILEAQRRFSNQLAVISLPMPLDGKCNPVMRSTPPAHVNACALARLGLTVWRADRQRAHQFDEWVFGPPNPPQPDAAEAYARQLVGTEAFDRAARDPWVTNQLRQDIAIYEANHRKRLGNMPQVIIGTNIISGPFNRDHLYRVLAEQFGLK